MTGLIEDVMGGIRDKVLPPRYGIQGTQNGILFCLDLAVSSYEKGDIFSQTCRVGVLIVNPHSVFVAKTEGSIFHDFLEHPLEEWRNTSNHESCWRTDGLSEVTKIYGQLCDGVNAQRKTAGLDAIAPRRMEGNIFHAFDLWTEVLVDTEPDKSDEYRYKRKIVRLSRQ